MKPKPLPDAEKKVLPLENREEILKELRQLLWNGTL